MRFLYDPEPALTPVEEQELRDQSDMRERGRRLRQAQALRSQARELRDNVTGARLYEGLPEGIADWLMDMEAA